MKLSDFLKSGTKQEQKQKKIATCAIIITLAALIITIITLCATSLIFSVRDNTPDTENTEETDNLDDVKYVPTTFDESKLYWGNLILINEENPVKDTWKNTYTSLEKYPNRPKKGENNTYTVADKINFKAAPEATEALNKMLGDYYKQSKDDDNLIVASAYLDSIAPTSEFASGMSFEFKYFVDVNIDFTKASIHGVDKYTWLYNNAYKYGFVSEGTKATAQNADNSSDKALNTFRYVGVEHATAMKNNGFVKLEDYINFLKSNHSYSNPLSFRTSNAKVKVYYCSADAVHIPERYVYNVSGDNQEGYIITVTSKKLPVETSNT